LVVVRAREDGTSHAGHGARVIGPATTTVVPAAHRDARRPAEARSWPRRRP